MPSLHPSPSTLIRQAHPNPGAPCLLPLNSQTHTFSLRQSDARGGVHLSSPLTYPPRPPPSPPHCAVSGCASAAPTCPCAPPPSPPPHLVQCLDTRVQLPRALVLPNHPPPPTLCSVSMRKCSSRVRLCSPTIPPHPHLVQCLNARMQLPCALVLPQPGLPLGQAWAEEWRVDAQPLRDADDGVTEPKPGLCGGGLEEGCGGEIRCQHKGRHAEGKGARPLGVQPLPQNAAPESDIQPHRVL